MFPFQNYEKDFDTFRDIGNWNVALKGFLHIR